MSAHHPDVATRAFTSQLHAERICQRMKLLDVVERMHGGSVQHLSSWEGGRSVPSLRWLSAWARVLGLELCLRPISSASTAIPEVNGSHPVEGGLPLRQ